MTSVKCGSQSVHLQCVMRIRSPQCEDQVPYSFIFFTGSNIWGNKGFFRLQKSQVLLILISNSYNNSILNCFSTDKTIMSTLIQQLIWSPYIQNLFTLKYTATCGQIRVWFIFYILHHIAI